MKIRILSCFQDLTQKDTGSSVRIYNLAKALAELDHKVYIVIPGNGEVFEWINRIVIHRINGFAQLGF